MYHLTDRIVHKTVFFTLAAEHWMEQEKAKWLCIQKSPIIPLTMLRYSYRHIQQLIIIIITTTTTTTTIIIRTAIVVVVVVVVVVVIIQNYMQFSLLFHSLPQPK